MGNLGTHQAGAVLRCGDFDAAADIENGHDERLELLLNALGKGGIENFAGDVESEFSHREIPFGAMEGLGWMACDRGSSPARARREERHARHHP